MNVSLRWLASLLGTDLDPIETRDRLLMLGAGVEGMEPLHHDLAGVVIGQVLEVRRHPNADRLSLCEVNAGAEIKHVVCGATNVVAGKKYPFAPVGTTLPGGVTLERRKIRGEVSEGMLCSERELGLGEDGDGILELETAAAPGTRLLDALPLADTRFVLEITPNRPDLLSHEGVARDLGAVLQQPVKLPPIPGAPAGVPRAARAASAGETAGVRVVIEDAVGCPRYTAAVIRGVKVRPSPAWLQDRLRAIGARPINNVVDATNYLLFENGQPLHAFDLAKLRGPAIVVRRAGRGETIVTLDGQSRQLTPETTVIADAERATAIAGVMGGAESEVAVETTDILLECAYFDPARTRLTRRTLGLSTEASYRFERGVDHDATPLRLLRAAELIVAVAGGRVDGVPVDVHPAPIPPTTIFVRDARIAHVLGVEIPRVDVERVLTALGCVVGPKDDRLAVQVPAWRPDLTREIDVIEEIARVVGYDRFPDDLRLFRPGTVPDAPSERLADRLRRVLVGLGLHEAITSSLGPRLDEREPMVLNPLSQEEAYLRADLLPGLVRRVEYNWRQMQRNVRLFEIGHVFHKKECSLPDEEIRVAAVVTGARRPPHWSEPEPPDYDLFDVKALLEAAARVVRPGAALAGEGSELVMRDAAGVVVGRGLEPTADRPAWAARVFGFELSVEMGEAPRLRAAPLPRSPAVERDVALVLPETMAAADVEATLRAGAGRLLERTWPFDEYRGAPLASGARSVAWRLVFREEGRTLREAEVDEALARALKEVEQRHGVRRREA
ncbi:MAG: phenylalanine--tRNA ligase subunit beta [Gemmatimonadetes bacterium]|nr:phenylalanine--tRNA ligase subunit beta [Gemmatimonadota bacterium]